MKITLAGVGMGDPANMTSEVECALIGADVIIGAPRLVAVFGGRFPGQILPLALPEQVAAAVAEHPEWERVCVALSGDVGLYSGAKKLLALLQQYEPEVLCGIASPQYFAARLRRPWQDFRVVSAHGIACDVLAETLNHPAVLFLAGTEIGPGEIAAILCNAGLDGAKMTVGENLSAANERILAGTAGEMKSLNFSTLCVVLVENDKTFTRPASGPGIADDAFLRGPAPMSKQGVRALALSLLRPRPDSILYDIGAGTGSVAVEMALLARRGRVYAIECAAEAFALLQANRERFGTYNLVPVFGRAPEVLVSLTTPDGVFIGGSKGKLRDIVKTLLSKNANIRLVVSAITLETLHMATTIFAEMGVADVDVCQIAVTRTVPRGDYHMLTAENPVFLISGGGTGET